LIQVEKYQNIVSRAIDEWIYWFKNEQVKEDSKSKNIEKVKDRLSVLKMSKEEREAYIKYLEKLASEKDILETAHADGRKEAYKELLPQIKEARQKAEQERREKELARQKAEQERREKELTRQKLLETAKLLKELNIDIQTIIKKTGLTREEIEKL